MGRLPAVALLVLSLSLLTGAGCGPKVDLATAVQITDVFSGWYDFGLENGLNKLVPSLSFRLKNAGTTPLSQIQLLVSFWQDGADGESDSKDVAGIGAAAVAPGGTSDPVLVRSGVGYTIDQPRAELFTHSGFKDFSARVFAKRDGRIVKIGEFKIDRRIIPHVAAAGRP
jgi:hypothetical protein